MEILKRRKRDDAHPYIPELQDLYQQGRITRREFLRNATLLGMSFAGASAFLAACGATPEPTPGAGGDQGPGTHQSARADQGTRTNRSPLRRRALPAAER